MMDAKVGKLITAHRMNHSRTDIQHLYVRKLNGWRSLTYKITSFRFYGESRQQLFNAHMKQRKNIKRLKKSEILQKNSTSYLKKKT